MSNKQIKVKVTTRFPSWSFIRQTPGSSGIWKNIDFFIDDETTECDWWVVFGGLIKEETVNCPPQNTILITDEPSQIKKYSQEFTQQFNTIITIQNSIRAPHITNEQLLPWYVGSHFNTNKNKFDTFDKSYDELKKQNNIVKTKLLSVIASNKNKTVGHRERLKFIKILKKHFGDRLDVFGLGINTIADKWDAIAPYKYHIVLENSVEENYWTEKLADSFLAQTYPLYYGCPNINDYFTPNFISKIDISDPSNAIEIIEKAIREDYYNKFNKEILESKEKVLDKYQIFPRLCEIINNLEKERKIENKILLKIKPEMEPKSNTIDKYIGLIGILLKKHLPTLYFELKKSKKDKNISVI